jgi:hypothetical protein
MAGINLFPLLNHVKDFLSAYLRHWYSLGVYPDTREQRITSRKKTRLNRKPTTFFYDVMRHSLKEGNP